MPRKKVLITVTTYPLPTKSYDELVCTAGILEDGCWIRIYPVPLSFLIDVKQSGKSINYKYTWIELDLIKRTDDFRPESHSPLNYDFRDIKFFDRIETDGNWAKRKELCLNNVYTDLSKLIEDSNAPSNVSLATFKPTEIKGLKIESVDREWKDEWVEIRKQTDLFGEIKSPEDMIPKLPYKFSYCIVDENGKESTMMIEDWEIGQLYWNCLSRAEGDETIALEKVKEQYETNFINNKDVYLFLGTTKEWHARRAPNPFVIIGVFYPKIEKQMRLL